MAFNPHLLMALPTNAEGLQMAQCSASLLIAVVPAGVLRRCQCVGISCGTIHVDYPWTVRNLVQGANTPPAEPVYKEGTSSSALRCTPQLLPRCCIPCLQEDHSHDESSL
jgi:hypothetical protein